MNASETLLRKILREMQEQTEILERIDRNLPQTHDLDPSEAETSSGFRSVGEGALNPEFLPLFLEHFPQLIEILSKALPPFGFS